MNLIRIMVWIKIKSASKGAGEFPRALSILLLLLIFIVSQSHEPARF